VTVFVDGSVRQYRCPLCVLLRWSNDEWVCDHSWRNVFLPHVCCICRSFNRR